METKPAFPSTEVQTVIFGRTDENGRANFIQQVEGDGRDIEVVASSEHPLFIHFANGPDSQLVRCEEPLRLKKSVQAGLLDRRINFLYAECRPDGSLALGVTDAAPNYSYKKECFSPETATIKMVANETLGHLVQASSVHSAPYEPYKAFDHHFLRHCPSNVAANTQTYYHSAAIFTGAAYGGKATITYQFAEATAVRAYSLLPCNAIYAPLCWSFFAIAPSGERQLLDRRSEEIAWKEWESRTFVCVQPSNAPFLRYQWEFTRVQANTSLVLSSMALFAPAHCFVIPEMRMYDESGSLSQRVFLGEIDCGIAEVRKITTYALRGRYQSEILNVGVNDAFSFHDNLGVPSALKKIGGKVRISEGLSWTNLDCFYSPNHWTGMRLCIKGRNCSFVVCNSMYVVMNMHEYEEVGDSTGKMKSVSGGGWSARGDLLVTVKRQF